MLSLPVSSFSEAPWGEAACSSSQMCLSDDMSGIWERWGRYLTSSMLVGPLCDVCHHESLDLNHCRSKSTQGSWAGEMLSWHVAEHAQGLKVQGEGDVPS